MEASTDGENWSGTADLSAHGITALDMQLSLIAPTVFGRAAIETCKSARDLLSLMLGYDDLENLGTLTTNLLSNRTRLENQETTVVQQDSQELRRQLAALPSLMNDDSPLRAEAVALSRDESPTAHQLVRLETRLASTIETAVRQLAEVVGLNVGEEAPAAGVAEKLTVAVSQLERGVWANLPSLSAIRLQMALPPTEKETPEQRLDDILDKVNVFCASAAKRISERFEWWRKEVEPGSRVSLLLKAAEFYNPEKQECPVCDRPLDDLPVKAELTSLRGVDPRLSRELRTFFGDLENELEGLLPEGLLDIGAATPSERILRDWAALRGSVLGEVFSSLAETAEAALRRVAEEITCEEMEAPQLIHDTVDHRFAIEARGFVARVSSAYKAISVLRWSASNIDGTMEAVHNVMTNEEQRDPESLLRVLAKGKQAAAETRPLTAVRTALLTIIRHQGEIARKEAAVEALRQLKPPLDEVKLLSGYAASEVSSIFDSIKDQTIEHWKKLYPERSTGLVRLSHFLRQLGVNRTSLLDDDVNWIENTFSSREARYVSYIVLFGAAA